MIIETKQKPEPCFRHGLSGNIKCPECCYRLLTFCESNNIHLAISKQVMLDMKAQSDKYNNKNKKVEVWFSKWLLASSPE